MRLLALGFAVIAVTVWWAPLPKFTQSAVLVFLSAALLALREAWKRLDRVNVAAREAKEILSHVRAEREGGASS